MNWSASTRSSTRRGCEPGGEATTNWLPCLRRATSSLATTITLTIELSMNPTSDRSRMTLAARPSAASIASRSAARMPRRARPGDEQ